MRSNVINIPIVLKQSDITSCSFVTSSQLKLKYSTIGDFYVLIGLYCKFIKENKNEITWERGKKLIH